MKTYDLVVVGSGAGMMVAQAAAAHGLTCALIEGHKFGGTCLNRGCIPSKTLVYPADLIREANKGKKVGVDLKLEGVDWPLISKRMWMQINKNIKIRAYLETVPNLDVYDGYGEFLTEDTLRVKRKDLTYSEPFMGKKILIATGGRSFLPEIPGLEQAECLTSEDFFGDRHPEKLYESITILGGGSIAVEFAHILSAFGVKVRLVQRSSRLLKKEEPLISDYVLKQLIKDGVEVWTNQKVVEMAAEEKNKKVTIINRDTGEKQVLESEEILVAMGIVPNTEQLNLPVTGIELDQDGWIITDPYLKTNQDHIFALGDINGKYQFRHKANYEAEFFIRNEIMNHPIRFQAEYNKVPWAIYCHPQVAHFGMTEEEALSAGHKIKIGINRYSEVAKGFAMGYVPGDEDDGFAKLIVDENNRILGAHVVGAQAAMVIQPFVYLASVGDVNSARPLFSQREEEVPLMWGDLEPLFNAMTIHPSLSEVAAWAIEKLDWHSPQEA